METNGNWFFSSFVEVLAFFSGFTSHSLSLDLFSTLLQSVLTISSLGIEEMS